MSDKDGKSTNRLLAIILILFLLVCFAGGGLAAAYFFMPSFTVDPYYKRVERGEPDELALVYEGEAIPSDYYALLYEDDVLIDADFINDYAIDTALFWDDGESVLTVSTPLKIIRMKPDEAFYTQNGERKEFPVSNTALNAVNGKVFIPASFASEFYSLDYYNSKEMKTLIIDRRFSERTTARAKRTASVRYAPDIKSDIAEKVKKGSELLILGESDGFMNVRTENGAFGYIKAGDVTDIRTIQAEARTEDEAPRPAKYDGKKISLIWDNISGSGGESNNWISGRLGNLNVVSPTWLKLSDSDGNITDAGSTAYAKTAMSTGYDVWPLFSNSFDADITHAALSSTSKRDKIVQNLIEILNKYGVNGVNIDFEAYRIEDGYYYTQFLKELCVSLRREGFITSVDLPPPTLQNSPTDRAQIGKYADYVVVMAYDQHWAGSQVKGPVAGYDWVKAGLERTAALVPSDKIVLGLPLYTRMWYQPQGSDKITSKDFAMEHVTELFALRNAATTWEENTKYMKGEYEYDIDGVRNTITAWLETIETLRFKAELVGEMELGGAAYWKKSLEAEGVWEMLAEVVR